MIPIIGWDKIVRPGHIPKQESAHASIAALAITAPAGATAHHAHTARFHAATKITAPTPQNQTAHR